MREQIALIEHKSSVDYNVSMQILRYMVYIWDDYERREEKRVSGISKLKGFKYPPVFPIVYYNGESSWTADKALKSRVALSDIFSPYIPNYEYHLVNTADHGNDELIKKNDGLDVLARVVAVLLRKHHVSENEVQDFVSQIKERHMSDLFANFKATVNVQEERRIGRKIGQSIGEETKLIKLVCNKLQKGWTAEKIADLFEEDLGYIQKIIEAAIEYAPDYDADKIYAKLHDEQCDAIKA